MSENGNGAKWWKSAPSWFSMIVLSVSIIAAIAVIFSEVRTNTMHRVEADKRLASAEQSIALLRQSVAGQESIGSKIDAQGRDINEIKVELGRMAERLKAMSEQILKDKR